MCNNTPLFSENVEERTHKCMEGNSMEKRKIFKRSIVMVLVLTMLAGVMMIVNVNTVQAQGGTYTVTGTKHYLALRTAPAYDSRNEIGKLYNGETVTVQDTSNKTYWYVYSPKLGKSGYVNKKYLSGGGGNSNNSGSYGSYTVTGTKNYLALRTAPAYDSRNEIGRLYNGETVTVQDTSNKTYWYVYSPKLGKSGYVNKRYLSGGGYSNNSGSYGTYTVRGTTNYLALRTEPAYDSRNEIGRLYNGETVTVQNKGNGTYWYVYSPKLGMSGYVNSKYLG